MTGPVQDNPYGVNVPGSRTSLPWLPPSVLDDHPLVPWVEDSHAGQWVDVDHALDQVKQFEQCLKRLPEMILPKVDTGHLVVVTGPVGMGKTTLIHRCVHLTRQHLTRFEEHFARVTQQAPPSAPGQPEVIRPPHPYVALTGGYDNRANGISTDARGQFASTQDINAALRDKIVDELSGYLPEKTLQRVRGEQDVHEAFKALSRLLAQQDALLLVLVPHMDWRDGMGSVRTDFLRSCLKHARSRIVLFVEVCHQDPDTAHEVVEEIWPDSALTHLKLGSLTSEDTVKFSQSARGDHPDPDAPVGSGAWLTSDVRQLRKRYFSIAEERRRTGGEVVVTAADLGAPALDMSAMARNPSAGAPVPRQSAPPPGS
ncbi:AAA family ATPase [Streptomyces sp. NPDC002306]